MKFNQVNCWERLQPTVVSGFGIQSMYLCIHGILHALGRGTYLSVWREEGALRVERVACFFSSPICTVCFPLIFVSVRWVPVLLGG